MYSDYDFDFCFLKACKPFLEKKQIAEEDMYVLYSYISEIITSDIWQQVSQFPHHNNYNRGDHLLNVCITAFIWGKKRKNYDLKVMSQASVCHDLFPYDWKIVRAYLAFLGVPIKTNFFDQHAFKHPLIAYQTFAKHFPELVSDKAADIILKHMWPLTITLPKYPESWLVSWSDKHDSFTDTIKKPNEWLQYVGIGMKKK